MIDFTNCIEEFNFYKGSEKKKTLIYNDKRYLVKFPDPVREKNKNISYINNAYSEYVGSNIFKLLGIEVQNTILGIYNFNGKEKIVCACEDFTDSNHILFEFEGLVLSTNPDKKIDTEVNDILEVLDEAKNMIDVNEVKDKFWELFIVDSLIGNTDRHNGNWGFLIDKLSNKGKFSPIYDCGSCLNPMLEDEELEKISDSELKNLAINCYSCLRVDGKKINYMSYISGMSNSDCNKAILRVVKKIDINKINEFIDNIEEMSRVRKDFYKWIINQRHLILESVYDKLSKMEIVS